MSLDYAIDTGYSERRSWFKRPAKVLQVRINWSDRPSIGVSRTGYKPVNLRAAAKANIGMNFSIEFSQWLAETEILSSTTAMKRAPGFKRVLALGQDIVPIVVGRMKKGDVHMHFFPLLRELTGYDAVSENHRGSTNAMARDWVDWFDNNHSRT